VTLISKTNFSSAVVAPDKGSILQGTILDHYMSEHVKLWHMALTLQFPELASRLP
jgi:hypothetical protein